MSVTVTLALTSWNTRAHTPFAVTALLLEVDRLKTAGFDAHVVCADNASHDGTAEYLSALHTHKRLVALHQKQPVGVSVLRNQILDFAFSYSRVDYILFVDGDIEVIPHSTVAMARYLEEHPTVMALAMDPALGGTLEEAAEYCPSIQATHAEALMYLCGYGMFRSEVFAGDVSFEQSGPFATPGWGSEDDDLYLQMVERGYTCQYANDFHYFHMAPRSSWPSLLAMGIDPITSHAERRGALLEKWRRPGLQRVQSGHLTLLQGQHVHV